MMEELQLNSVSFGHHLSVLFIEKVGVKFSEGSECINSWRGTRAADTCAML